MEKNINLTKLENKLDATLDAAGKIETIKELILLEDKRVGNVIKPYLKDTDSEIRYQVILGIDKYSIEEIYDDIFNIFTKANETEKNKALILQILATRKYNKIVEWIESILKNLTAKLKLNEPIPPELKQKIIETSLLKNIIESCSRINKSTLIEPLVKLIQLQDVKEDIKKVLLNFGIQAMKEIWKLRENSEQSIRFIVYDMSGETKNEKFLLKLINFLDECNESDYTQIFNNIAKYEWSAVFKLVNKIKTANESYKPILLKAIIDICSKVTFDETKSKELAQYIVGWLNSKTTALTPEELEFFVVAFAYIKDQFSKHIKKLLDSDAVRENTKNLIKHTLKNDEYRKAMLAGVLDAISTVKKQYLEDILIIINEIYQSTSDQDILKKTIEKLHSGSKKAIKFAKDTLLKIGSKSTPVLVEHLNTPDIPKEAKINIIKLLGELRDASVVQEFNKKAAEENEDEEICIAYIEALKLLRNDSSIPILGNLLRHPSWAWARRKSAEVLGAFNNDDIIPFLLSGLEDADEVVMQNSANSLKKYKTPNVAEPLRICYDSQSHSPKTRSVVLSAMHELREAYESELIALNEKIRKEAIETLGRLKLEESLPILEERVNEEPVRELRKNIRLAINSIKGMSPVPEPIDINRCGISDSRTCNIKPGQNRDEVFIIASCDEEFKEERDQLKLAIAENGLRPEFAEENIKDLGKDAYCQKICSKIIGSRFCVVLLNSPKYKNEKMLELLKKVEAIDSSIVTQVEDIIGEARFPSPNVYYEYGVIQMAQTRCIPILIRDQEKDFAFDIRNIGSVLYNKGELSEKHEEEADFTKFTKNMKDLIRSCKEETKRVEEQE